MSDGKATTNLTNILFTYIKREHKSISTRISIEIGEGTNLPKLISPSVIEVVLQTNRTGKRGGNHSFN